MRRDLIFVAASAQGAANAACEAAGLGPFTIAVGLVPDTASPAEPPATDFMCCTAFGEETAAALDTAGVAYRRHLDARGVSLAEDVTGGKLPEQARADEALQRIRAETQ